MCGCGVWYCQMLVITALLYVELILGTLEKRRERQEDLCHSRDGGGRGCHCAQHAWGRYGPY